LRLGRFGLANFDNGLGARNDRFRPLARRSCRRSAGPGRTLGYRRTDGSRFCPDDIRRVTIAVFLAPQPASGHGEKPKNKTETDDEE
jgi:hypothetical protein